MPANAQLTPKEKVRAILNKTPFATYQSIASKTGVSCERVRQIATEFGFGKRTGTGMHIKNSAQINCLVKENKGKKFLFKELAEALATTPQKLNKNMGYWPAQQREQLEALLTPYTGYTPDEIVERKDPYLHEIIALVDKGISDKEIQKTLNCFAHHILRVRTAYRLGRRTLNPPESIRNLSVLETKLLIKKLMVECERDKHIATKLGVSEAYIKLVRKGFGLFYPHKGSPKWK